MTIAAALLPAKSRLVHGGQWVTGALASHFHTSSSMAMAAAASSAPPTTPYTRPTSTAVGGSGLPKAAK
ncbi:hypothetical protein AMTR_s00016p00260260 [Amborella trichopoda]|uniref:Uncharacterized protein n=1 Tax=Amborella trichopoda TaxID=13333 RepID=W1PH80_AMBTC|nr:hypothetical protein AMTR_s00016p00260260 [Amborella trichopoda]